MTPAGIARNAAAIRNLAARLERLGFTGDSHTEAEHIAVNLLADGYKRVEPPPALVGTSSTEEGRAKARRLYEETRRAKEGAR